MVGKHDLRITILALAISLAVLPASEGHAQEYELYAGLVKSTGYVVGSPLARSGFHRLDSLEDTTWTQIGWSLPRVSALAINPNNQDEIFLSCGNGVLRSQDNGKSWKIVTGWEFTEGQGIAMDPNRTQDVYAASAYGIWRTNDGGETWIESNNGFRKTYTQNVAVDRTTPGRVLAATDGGVYLSVDGAQNWKIVTDDAPVLDIHQSDADPNIWVAATRGRGVWVSKDNGNTWNEVRSRKVRGKTIHAAVLDPTNPDRMAAAGWNTGVMISNTGGASWKVLRKGLPIDDFYELVFDPMNPGRLYAATIERGIFYTDNEGKSWHSAGMYGTLFFDLQFVKVEDGQ